MSSTRLPGKVLADVGGEPLLALLIRRARRARRVGGIVLATSDGVDDDPVAALGARLDVAVHRGSLIDVLGRTVGALAGLPDDAVGVRVTGDCPLIDGPTIDAVVGALEDPTLAYAQNVEPRSVPDGCDCEAMRMGALRQLAASTDDAAEREHVTLGLRRRGDRWPAIAVPVVEPELAALRWTVDTDEDLAFVRAVVAHLGERRHHAGIDEIRRTVLDAGLGEGGLRG